LKELIRGASFFALYIVPSATVMLLLRRSTRIGDELFRKSLHFIMVGAYILFFFAFRTW